MSTTPHLLTGGFGAKWEELEVKFGFKLFPFFFLQKKRLNAKKLNANYLYLSYDELNAVFSPSQLQILPLLFNLTTFSKKRHHFHFHFHFWLWYEIPLSNKIYHNFEENRRFTRPNICFKNFHFDNLLTLIWLFDV